MASKNKVTAPKGGANPDPVQRGVTAYSKGKQIVKTGVETINKVRKAKTKAGKVVPIVKGIADVAEILFNHDEWFNRYADKLVNANFGRRRGIPEIHNARVGVSYNNQFTLSMPSVTDLGYVIHIPNDPQHSFQQVINEMYNSLRSANSGSINYRPADLEHYVMSLQTLRTLYGEARRAYEILHYFSSVDSAIPQIFFAAFGKDYDTFRANAADFRMNMQLFGDQLKVTAPGNWPALSRADWLSINMFRDGEDAKASFYCFNMRVGLIWNDQTESYDQIDTYDTGDSTRTGMLYSDYIAIIRNAIKLFVDNSIFQIIAGDMFKAFGEAAIFPSLTWDLNPKPHFTYDKSALLQIWNYNNAATEGVVTRMTGASATELSNPTISVKFGSEEGGSPVAADLNCYAEALTPYINTDENEIRPVDVLKMATFIPSIKDVNGALNNEVPWTSWGLEVPTQMFSLFIATGENANTIQYGIRRMETGFRVTSAGNGSWTALANVYAVLQDATRMSICASNSRYYPRTVYAFVKRTSGNQQSEKVIDLHDWANYAKVSTTDIETYHAFATLSLFQVPTLVKQSTNKVVNVE